MSLGTVQMFVACMQDTETPLQAVSRVCASFMVPQGYPESVSGQYTEYMSWRGMQYFFGGALSVYTTKALLSAVGLKRGAGASAAAINWVVKDGAGLFHATVVLFQACVSNRACNAGNNRHFGVRLFTPLQTCLHPSRSEQVHYRYLFEHCIACEGFWEGSCVIRAAA